jgi:hypothetical protein
MQLTKAFPGMHQIKFSLKALPQKTSSLSGPQSNQTTFSSPITTIKLKNPSQIQMKPRTNSSMPPAHMNLATKTSLTPTNPSRIKSIKFQYLLLPRAMMICCSVGTQKLKIHQKRVNKT